MTGNKLLTDEDVEPLLKTFAELLMEKNVAQETAASICESVQKNLVNTRTESFTTVTTTVRNTLVDSITKLLTPKRNIDLLKEAISAKKKG